MNIWLPAKMQKAGFTTEKYLGDDGEIDLSKFTPITYDPVHHGYYRLGERVGNAFKDGAQLK